MTTVETLKDFFVTFGAEWVLWLLFVLSIGSLAVAIERFIFFRSRSESLRGLVASLDAHLRTKDASGAIETLEGRRSVAASVAAAGLRLAERGPRAVERGMDSAMALQRKALESRLSYLGTLGNNAPFIGLLGTVIGVILAFEALGQAEVRTSAGSSGVASSEVMSAIAEALVATAVGIGVALPAVALYNYFQRQIASILSDSETLKNLVLAYLEDTSGEPGLVAVAREQNGAQELNLTAATAAGRAEDRG